MINFNKVNALPGTLAADSFYFVLNGSYAEAYVTNSAGVAKSIGNSDMINALIDQKLNAVNRIRHVADIATRDTDKASLTADAMYLVTNATGDPTVASGAAMYYYDKAAGTFTKIAEYESMDVVIQWAAIQGKPNSTPAAIDTAVGKAHTHTNIAVLDKLTQGGDGKLLYDNKNVSGAEWNTTNW